MKKVKLVSVSFPGRDLSLGVVSLKSSALKDKEVATEYSIGISQFHLDTPVEDMYVELKKGIDLYGFSAYVWNINKILDVAKRLKKANPKAKILLGGPEASGMAHRLLRKHDFLDYVIREEGEVAFTEFLKTRDLSTVPGLVYKRNGSVVSNQPAHLQNLDDLLLPYENEDYQNYLDDSPTPVRAAIETSRGCPFSCRYCSWGEKQMRYFDLEKLKPAFKFLFDHPKVATVYITDSNPFLKKERAKELLRFLIENNTQKKPVTFELNPEYITDDMLLELITHLYKEEFAFGVQSTSPLVLEKMGRKFDAERYKRNIRLMKEKNPNTRMQFSLIIGLPGDNYKQFSESLDFVLNLKPEGIYVHELLCLPGSEFYNSPEKYGLRFDEEAPHTIKENASFPQDEYNKAKNLGYHTFLIHRFPHIKEDLFELSRNKTTRVVDMYSKFIDFIDGKIDTLTGKSILDVQSWFFEKYTDLFMGNAQNAIRFESLYNSFKELQNGTNL